MVAKKKEKTKSEEPKIVYENVMDPDYKEHHIKHASGGFSPDGMFQMTLADDYPTPFKEINNGEELVVIRKHKVRIIMSPVALKSISDWLAEKAKSVQVAPQPPDKTLHESETGKAYA